MSPHILLADDEEQIRSSIKLTLETSSYKVTAVSNGCEALEVIRTKEDTDDQVSLILSDLFMPGMDGLHMITEIKKLKRKISILVITGYGTRETIVGLIREGVDEFLEKPFQSKELREKTSMILARQKNLV